MKKRSYFSFLLLLILCGLIGLLFLILNIPSGPFFINAQTSSDPVADGILNKFHQKYSPVQSVRLTFEDELYTLLSERLALKSRTGKTTLYHALAADRIKIENDKTELLKDVRFGLVGSYEGAEGADQYNHLMVWLAAVYRMAFLPPAQLREFAGYCDVRAEPLDKKGQFRILFTSKNKTDPFTAEFIADMNSIAITKILIRKKEYSVSAKLDGFIQRDRIGFPRKIYARYESASENYICQTKISGVELNSKFRDEIFAFKKELPFSRYADPLWLDDSGFLMVKVTGRKIKTSYSGAAVVDKNFYLVRTDRRGGHERVVRHLLFSKEDTCITRFILSGHYNGKRDLLAYSVFPSRLNSNKALAGITGVYIHDMRSGKQIKVSEQGFSPLWSRDGARLIWSQASGKEPGKNDVWICDPDGGRKALLFENGFNCLWTRDSRALVFERGWWIFGKGLNIPRGMRSEEIRGGICLYSMDTGKTEVLHPRGFKPALSADGKKIVFSDRLENSGFYILDLETRKTDRIVEMKPAPVVLQAVWCGDKLLYSSTERANRNYWGLYQFSPAEKADFILSNKIFYDGVHTAYLDLSSDNRYLLYKFYNHPDWDTCTWGVFDMKERSILAHPGD